MHRIFFSLLIVGLTATFASAVPVNFHHIQTDSTTGTGKIAGLVNGVLMTADLPTATVVQNDATAQPVPGSAVGFVTGGTDGNPGGGIGVHLGWSGTVQLTGQIRDDLDPNTGTSNSAQFNFYTATATLASQVGESHRYVFNTFDDNSSVAGTNDVTNSLTHRGWIGDNGSGHRHSDGTFGYGAGADTFRATATFNLAGGAAGDDLGITAGVGAGAPNDTLFIDDIIFTGAVDSTAFALSGQTFGTATTGLITNVALAGTSLAPEGTSIETGAFGEDALAFTDRTHEWNSNAGDPTIAALGLVGTDYIRFANDDRSVADLTATIDLEGGVKNLYVLIDNRIGDANVDNILNGNAFVELLIDGVDIGVDESGDGSINQTSRVFVLADFDGTQIVLGAQGQGGTNMYGFVAQAQVQAVPEPTTALLGVMGLTLLGTRRRRQA